MYTISVAGCYEMAQRQLTTQHRFGTQHSWLVDKDILECSLKLESTLTHCTLG